MSFAIFRAPGIRVTANDDNRVAVHVGLGQLPALLSARQAIELGAGLVGFGLSVDGKHQAIVDDINAVIRKYTEGK